MTIYIIVRSRLIISLVVLHASATGIPHSVIKLEALPRVSSLSYILNHNLSWKFMKVVKLLVQAKKLFKDF